MYLMLLFLCTYIQNSFPVIREAISAKDSWIIYSDIWLHHLQHPSVFVKSDAPEIMQYLTLPNIAIGLLGVIGLVFCEGCLKLFKKYLSIMPVINAN
jgi:hypothetical protein